MASTQPAAGKPRCTLRSCKNLWAGGREKNRASRFLVRIRAYRCGLGRQCPRPWFGAHFLRVRRFCTRPLQRRGTRARMVAAFRNGPRRASSSGTTFPTIFFAKPRSETLAGDRDEEQKTAFKAMKRRLVHDWTRTNVGHPWSQLNW